MASSKNMDSNITLFGRLQDWQGKDVDIQLLSGFSVSDKLVYVGHDYLEMEKAGIVPLSAVVMIGLATWRDPVVDPPEQTAGPLDPWISDGFRDDDYYDYGYDDHGLSDEGEGVPRG